MAKKEMTKAEKFVDLGQKRMTKALGAIRQVGRLANKNAYDYDAKQAEQIVKDLTDEVKALAEAFKTGKAAQSSGYKL